MKSAVIALALAGSAVAQNLSGEPACASSCLVSAISAAGCAPDDVACQCGPTQSAIATLVAPCLLAGCAGSALIQAESAGLALCSIYSMTAGLPATASASATSGAATNGTASGTMATITSTSKTSAPAFSNTTVTTGTKTATKSGSSGTGATTSTSTAGAATMAAGMLAAFVGLVAAL